MPKYITISTLNQVTEGPYEPGLSVEGDLCIYTPGGTPIATIIKELGGHEMPSVENATLLAASWDLLRSNRELLSIIGTYLHPDMCIETIAAARAIIEKATTMEVTT